MDYNVLSLVKGKCWPDNVLCPRNAHTHIKNLPANAMRFFFFF